MERLPTIHCAGAKGMLYEGGIREPLIVRLPGVTSPGTRCSEPVIGVDLYPTFIEVAGAEADLNPDLDGLSLLPVLKDPAASLQRDSIFWHFPCYLQGSGDPHGGPFRTTPAGAIRKGDYKLIEWFETGRRELYNLVDDIGETNDLSSEQPALLAELHADMKNWRARVSAPVPTTLNPKYDPAAGQKKKQQRPGKKQKKQQGAELRKWRYPHARAAVSGTSDRLLPNSDFCSLTFADGFHKCVERIGDKRLAAMSCRQDGRCERVFVVPVKLIGHMQGHGCVVLL